MLMESTPLYGSAFPASRAGELSWAPTWTPCLAGSCDAHRAEVTLGPCRRAQGEGHKNQRPKNGERQNPCSSCLVFSRDSCTCYVRPERAGVCVLCCQTQLCIGHVRCLERSLILRPKPVRGDLFQASPLGQLSPGQAGALGAGSARSHRWPDVWEGASLTCPVIACCLGQPREPPGGPPLPSKQHDRCPRKHHEYVKLEQTAAPCEGSTVGPAPSTPFFLWRLMGSGKDEDTAGAISISKSSFIDFCRVMLVEGYI